MLLHAGLSGSSLLQGVLVAIVAALASAALAYGIGVRVTDRWDERKRRREADLAALVEFYRLYGDFFKIWKLWNIHKLHTKKVTAPALIQWELLQRAADVEGGFEAFLVKLVAERRFDQDEIDRLGCFREGYQTLRETIREDKALGWWSSSWHGSDPRCRPTDRYVGFLQYRSFKALAEHFAVQLSNYGERNQASGDDAISTLLAATRRQKYKKWWELAAERLNLGDEPAQTV
ncbi:MAG: hypothetical protein ACLP50_33305 [Solirubrobacteraceae bacterium]